MQPDDAAKLLGVFGVALLVVLAATAVVGFGASRPAGSPDGASIDGQSPSQFQPDDVIDRADPEEGEVTVEGIPGEKRLLIETLHGSQVDRQRLQPLIEPVIEAGHSVRYSTDFADQSFNETLREFDAVLIPFPIAAYDDDEIAALQAFTEAGGRVVVLGGPTEYAVSIGLFGGTIEPVTFGANDLLREYGMRMGADLLYNVRDDANDNNYKSIYSSPAGTDALTAEVETVDFDTAGYVLIPDGSDAKPVLMAADGTKRFSTRRGGEYVTAARNGNFVLVGDTTFLEDRDIHDVDNERFVSNLLRFLLTAEKDPDVP